VPQVLRTLTRNTQLLAATKYVLPRYAELVTDPISAGFVRTALTGVEQYREDEDDDGGLVDVMGHRCAAVAFVQQLGSWCLLLDWAATGQDCPLWTAYKSEDLILFDDRYRCGLIAAVTRWLPLPIVQCITVPLVLPYNNPADADDGDADEPDVTHKTADWIWNLGAITICWESLTDRQSLQNC